MGFTPTQRIPDFESLAQLKKLRKGCYQLERYKDFKLLGLNFFDPYSFKPGPKTSKARDRENSTAQIIGLLVKTARDGYRSFRGSTHERNLLPRFIRGLCLRCSKTVFSAKECARVHESCYVGEYRKGLPPETEQEQLMRERLQTLYIWTTRNKLGGDSLKTIGDDFSVSDETVRLGINEFIDYLPDPNPNLKLVTSKFQKTILLIRSALKGPNLADSRHLWARPISPL
jgi:hypothetical protein